MAHKLANETWATILGCILDVPDDDFISCETLSGPFSWHDYSNADVLLVCKRWLQIATPLVFHTCIIRSTAQAQALDDLLRENPEFGTLIEQLRLEGCYGASVANILKKATRLQDLAITLPASSEDNGKPLFAVLDTLKPHRLIVCNSPTNIGEVLVQFALTALRSFIKTCYTLNTVVLEVPLARTLSSDLAASPSSILRLSTWKAFPTISDFKTFSDLFTTLRSLRRVEILTQNLAHCTRRPSHEMLAKVGQRLNLRIPGERTGINLREHFAKRDKPQVVTGEAPTLPSGRPALFHAPAPLRSTVWMHVLWYACQERHPFLSPLSLVCRMFWVTQREGPHILPDNTLIAACFPSTTFHSEI